MNLKKIVVSIILSTVTSLVMADDGQFNSMANGACMISISKDGNKFVGFNDRWSLSATEEQLKSGLQDTLNKLYFKNNERIEFGSLGFHCGGYGTSFVAKIEVANNEYCVWFRPNGKSFDLRSIGSTTTKERSNGQDFCHGRKVGELIIGLNDESLINTFRDDEVGKYFFEISKIADKTYKIVLSNEYNFKEEDVAKVLNEKYGKQIRYLEFNEYQHPIGDFLSVK